MIEPMRMDSGRRSNCSVMIPRGTRTLRTEWMQPRTVIRTKSRSVSRTVLVHNWDWSTRTACTMGTKSTKDTKKDMRKDTRTSLHTLKRMRTESNCFRTRSDLRKNRNFVHCNCCRVTSCTKVDCS